MSHTIAPSRRVTTATLRALRQRHEPAVWITAYDYPTAVFADRAGADVLLVGDSAAMTMLGHESTTSITMDEMLVFTRAVCRGAKRALVVGDMPFLSYQPSNARAVLSAGAFITAGCSAVKCEGGRRVAPRVRAIADAGIAVMGHLGLTPQSLGQLGPGYSLGESRIIVDSVADTGLAAQGTGIDHDGINASGCEPRRRQHRDCRSNSSALLRVLRRPALQTLHGSRELRLRRDRSCSIRVH